MDLSYVLAKLKGEKNLTTEALAQLSGVPRGTINKILNGETLNPRARTLKQLALALGCDAQDLYDTQGETPAPRIDAEGGYEENPRLREPDRPGNYLPDYDFILRAPDESMSGMGISEGDAVFILRRREVPDGRIALIGKGGERFLAQVYRRGDTLILITQKKGEPPEAAITDDARIEGQAMAVQHIF